MKVPALIRAAEPLLELLLLGRRLSSEQKTGLARFLFWYKDSRIKQWKS